MRPAYVDLQATKAIVRFTDAEDAEMFLKRNNINTWTLRLLSENETKVYFVKAANDRVTYKDSIQKKRHAK